MSRTFEGKSGKLRVNPDIRIGRISTDQVYWTENSHPHVLSRPHLGELLTFLAQSSDVESLLVHFASHPSVINTMDEMIAAGLIEDAAFQHPLVLLCRDAAVPPHHLMRKRWTEGATIVSQEQNTGHALLHAFQRLGVPVAADGSLRVVAVSDYADEQLDTIHREFLSQHQPWVLVKLTGDEILLGPFFHPPSTACWQCLRRHLSEVRWLTSQWPSATADSTHGSSETLHAAAELAAKEVTRWLLESEHTLSGQLRSFSWSTLESRKHTVLRYPDCPDCGSPRTAQPHAPTQALRFPSLRSEPTSAILQKLAVIESPICGIVDRRERIDLAPDPPVFTYGARYRIGLPPEARRIPGLTLRPGGCSGRGWTLDQAKAACLAEGLERYSLQYRGDEPVVVACHADLQGAIDPASVLLFSERQFAERVAWNRTHSLEEQVPEPFDSDAPIEWFGGWSLRDRSARFLPMALCYQYYRPADTRWIADADSNGCATGSTLDEAILHGILELVERDALSIWWFNRLARPAYSWECLPDSDCLRVCRDLSAKGWSIRIHDITTDLDIPAIVAVAETEDGGWIRGSGCHPDRGSALRTAVCELWQLSRSRVRPGPPPPVTEYRDDFALTCHDRQTADLTSVTRDCVEKFDRAGYELIAFDQSRAELPMPLARVIAPGLRHSKPRFAPGRLYTLPVQLGWFAEPRQENDLPTLTA